MSESIAHNVAAFLCALVVLEKGADVFIDHTVIVAKRTGIPQTAVALLTAGAEWEELAVVIVSLSKGRGSLALGNVIGSTVSNILGAFSLGLVFYKDKRAQLSDELFDADISGSGDHGQRRTPVGPFSDSGSKVYVGFLAIVTAITAVLLAFGPRWGINWRAAGWVEIAAFAAYLLLISYFIARGMAKMPESLSDSDSDFDTSDMDEDEGTAARSRQANANETTQLLPRSDGTAPAHTSGKPLIYHVGLLLAGFGATLLSSYLLSTAASNLIDIFDVSETLFGIVFLSIATTIPEKFVAGLGGYKGHMGIVLANTVGSNIFLLTLCLGIVWVKTGGDFSGDDGLMTGEIIVMLLSGLIMIPAVYLRGRALKTLGILMLLGYLAFIVVDFLVLHAEAK